MRTATPAVTQYVDESGAPRAVAVAPAVGAAREPRRRRDAPRQRRSARALNYATSPLLASQDAAVALALRGGAGRPGFRGAGRPRGVPADHRHRFLPGAGREALRAHRWTCRPAAAASSTATARCWPPACRCRRSGPSRRTSTPTRRSAAQLAALLGHDAGRARRSALEDKRDFVWLKRQIDEALWQAGRGARHQGRVPAARIPAATTPKAKRPRTSSASPTSTTRARRASSSPFSTSSPGRAGTRRVIKDRLGRVVEDVGEQRRAGERPRPRSCRSTARSSSSPTSAARRGRRARRKAGSVVVLDVQSGEILALANYPSYDPNNRRT